MFKTCCILPRERRALIQSAPRTKRLASTRLPRSNATVSPLLQTPEEHAGNNRKRRQKRRRDKQRIDDIKRTA